MMTTTSGAGAYFDPVVAQKEAKLFAGRHGLPQVLKALLWRAMARLFGAHQFLLPRK
jgi:hypothetical protein